MKLPITTLLLASFASAATIPTIKTFTAPAATEDTHAVFFPGSAQTKESRTQITNAELMRKGLPLAKPVKLYNAAILAKRIDPVPPTASAVPAGGAVIRYRFLYCASDATYTQPEAGFYSVGTASVQQTANECAALSHADGPSNNTPERFVIDDYETCITRIISGGAAACITGSLGIYEIVS